MTTLVANPVAANAILLGLGSGYGIAQVADIYTATNTTSATITPLTSTLVIEASGTMTAVTVNLPVNAIQGQRIKIFTNQIITTLTLTAGSTTTNSNGIADTVIGGVTTIGTANTGVEYVYSIVAPTSAAGGSANVYTWYRCG